MTQIDYCKSIYSAFDYLLGKYPEVFIIGQGLWSPWYVGNTMKDLDKKYGRERIIDTPVSESACTGAAVGASLLGLKPIIVHPRMDFMLYSMDSIVNQAAKWNYMFGGKSAPSLTIRAIINRGGEQGAQHSQSLHSWFSHIPGLRVVMPSTSKDARDLLIASVLSPDPVMFIEDRWLYQEKSELDTIKEKSLQKEGPRILKSGSDLTIVASGYSTKLALEAEKELSNFSISAEVIDTRILNPLNITSIVKSVIKTKHLIVVDGGWKSCGFASEIISSLIEKIPLECIIKNPIRITLPDCPAPTSTPLEESYYPGIKDIVEAAEYLTKD